VNKNISKRNANKYSILVCITIFLSVISLSGCVDNQNTKGEDLNKFIGTWTGNLEIPIFGRSNNTTINQLIFTETLVSTYLTSERGTLAPPNKQPFNDSTSFNDTRPPFNETWPQNGTTPPNDTWSPNFTRPFNGEQPPNGQRALMEISFTYSFNKEFNILYLNDSQFLKV
jgi:hypothetical protein